VIIPRSALHASRAVRLLAGVALLTTLAACGKKGDPLAPLRLVPSAVTEVAARKTAQDVELRFALPTANVGVGGPIDLDRIEIYAMTIGPGAVAPANRDLLTKEHVVGTIAVKPPPVDGEEKPAAANAPPDKRPSPGDRVTFLEQLTAEKLKPVPMPAAAPQPAPATTAPAATPPVATAPATAPATPPSAAPPTPATTATSTPPAAQPATPPAAAPGATPAAAAATGAGPEPPPAPVSATHPVRIYALRGISRAGRPGPPSTRLSIPLVSPVSPPSSVVAQMPTEKGIVVDWTPPVAEPGATPLTFNVLRVGGAPAPINPAPIADVKIEVPAEYGKEQCFVVRTIQTIQNITLESDASAPACLTPVDRFPPAAPKGVRAVAEDGAVNLVWDQNTEADLGGYLVLRGETPGETLQPLMPQPIKDANYRDATVKPGVRYTYAVVAVDNATPRNTSAPSAPESVTAR
jgi:predicted small lipoprotein YifL